jgi:hypothetical protein
MVKNLFAPPEPACGRSDDAGRTVALCERAVLSEETQARCISRPAGTPIVSIFGPTSSDRNGPFDARTLSSSAEWCLPRYERDKCPLEHWECMEHITVDQFSVPERLGMVAGGEGDLSRLRMPASRDSKAPRPAGLSLRLVSISQTHRYSLWAAVCTGALLGPCSGTILRTRARRRPYAWTRNPSISEASLQLGFGLMSGADRSWMTVLPSFVIYPM